MIAGLLCRSPSSNRSVAVEVERAAVLPSAVARHLPGRVVAPDTSALSAL
jgi:hypothetical protein